METNQPFQTFCRVLQHALTHLFDPDYSAPEELIHLVSDRGNSSVALQSLLIQEIKGLKPGHEVPSNSRTQRSFSILSLRFIDGLTQERTAEQLQLSLRSLQRAQRQAVYYLANRLRNRSCPDLEDEDSHSTPEMWRSQLDHEIDILSQKSPTAQSEFNTVLEGVKRITSARSPRRFELRISVDKQNLMTPFHAPVLQQILLSLLDSVMDYAPSEVVDIQAQTLEDTKIRIRIIGGDSKSNNPLDLPLVDGLLAMQEGCILITRRHSPLTLELEIPLVKVREKHVTVLFVDDNTDLATLFSSYCTGTPYNLVHVSQGVLALQRIAEVEPDLIVLDVMLPDVDGWELLMQLHANPATSAIPVIVCSVVIDTHLALDLGAKLYLQKPVWRKQLLDAFKSVLNPEI